MKEFKRPAFASGPIEVRVEDGELCIYASADGLRRLAEVCKEVGKELERRASHHVHLEDRDLIDGESDVRRVVLAGFAC